MLSLGQVLKGKIGTYKLTSKLERCVWLATAQSTGQSVVVKHADHSSIGKERDMLRHFQSQTPHIRPLLDEVDLANGSKWPALVLRYLESDLLSSSNRRILTRKELKLVSRGILEALQVLHKDGLVHTDIKPSNVLVNYDSPDGHITEVQIADLEGVRHQDSEYAKSGGVIGTGMFRSTEAFLELPWGTSTDIWSFGATLISLIYGEYFHIFEPDVEFRHEDYDIKILLKHTRHFGPFPPSYSEIADDARLEICTWLMKNSPQETMMPFERTSNKEVSEVDKQFVLKMMKLDPRARATVTELLEDEWFEND